MKSKAVIFIVVLISIVTHLKSQDTAQSLDLNRKKDESPFRLKKFSQGFNLGYEAGLNKFSNQLFTGHYITFCSSNERYALNIDSYLFYNARVNKFGLNSTFSYRLPNFFSLALSSDFYFGNKRLYYRPGLGINYELGGFLAVGSYYYFQSNTSQLKSNIGLRLVLRPFYVLALINNS